MNRMMIASTHGLREVGRPNATRTTFDLVTADNEVVGTVYCENLSYHVEGTDRKFSGKAGAMDFAIERYLNCQRVHDAAIAEWKRLGEVLLLDIANGLDNPRRAVEQYMALKPE